MSDGYKLKYKVAEHCQQLFSVTSDSPASFITSFSISGDLTFPFLLTNIFWRCDGFGQQEGQSTMRLLKWTKDGYVTHNALCNCQQEQEAVAWMQN